MKFLKRHYAKYIIGILLEIKKGEWIKGKKICQLFDKYCADGKILDTNGNFCQGFAYDYLFGEVIGYKKGTLVESSVAPPQNRSMLYPVYREMEFRLKPEFYDDIKSSINTQI